MLLFSSICSRSALIFFFLYFASLVPTMTSNGDSAGKNTSNQACAACRHQRRKCHQCPLAPYFPPNHTQQFLNVHKLFGVSNVMKILNSLPRTEWPNAMNSIQIEADARRDDPVNGCTGIINLLRAEIQATTRELDIIKHQLFFCKQNEQQQQLQQQHLQNMLASSSIRAPPLGGYLNHSQELIELANEAHRIGCLSNTAANSQPSKEYVDPKPFDEMKQTTILDRYEARESRIGYLPKWAANSQPFQENKDQKSFDEMMQTTNDRYEAEESSAESTAGDTPPLEKLKPDDRPTDIGKKDKQPKEN